MTFLQNILPISTKYLCFFSFGFPFQKYVYPIGIFQVNHESGEILTSANIDREERSSYKLDIMVSDKDPEQPRRNYTQVEIGISDVNDNQPKFSQDSWSLQIAENIAVNSKLLQVKCLDLLKFSSI